MYMYMNYTSGDVHYRNGVSTNVIVLKSALSTFFAVLDGTLEHFSGYKVLMLVLVHFLLKLLMKHN